MPKKFPREFKARALRLLGEASEQHESEFEAIRAVSTKLGIAPETLRRWQRRAEIDRGVRPGVTSGESVEMRRLRRENAELRRANEIVGAPKGVGRPS